MPSLIPEDVQRLVEQHIDSVEQLDVLLLLKTTAPRAWLASALAAELRISPRSAERRLAYLSRAGLAEADGQAAYQYAPRTPDLDAAVSALAQFHRARPVAIVSLIFARPLNRLNMFADAFVIKKDKDK